jgi:hypothetical protein
MQRIKFTRVPYYGIRSSLDGFIRDGFVLNQCPLTSIFRGASMKPDKKTLLLPILLISAGCGWLLITLGSFRGLTGYGRVASPL